MKNYGQKAQEIEDQIELQKYQQYKLEKEKLQEEIKDIDQTEYGKIEHYLYEGGWEERVTGVSFNEIKGKNEEEQEKKLQNR